MKRKHYLDYHIWHPHKVGSDKLPIYGQERISREELTQPRNKPNAFISIWNFLSQMMFKSQFPSEYNAHMLMKFLIGDNTAVKYNTRRMNRYRLARKVNFYNLFIGSGLKDTFHCSAHSLITSKSTLSLLAQDRGSLTTENRDVSSAKILTVVFRFWGRPFMKIKTKTEDPG